ncbi:hypothetical protein QYE76_015381 [Lolium multiflorum]|uniref:RRM domain-containing protein n=1 Tax=Lolium multiflorum TaxID=4521 RepID=A0AAD8U816_LOLMU|nr:hypothetical protein QYE76_015381 [Lolium multiflorum]
MGLPREVVEISSDEEEGCSGKLSVSPGPLGWVAKIGASPAPVPRKKKGRSAGVRGVKYEDGEDDDCVVLEGDPHRPVAAAGAKGRSASDEVEIVAVKGECYCFVCDAPAPCKYWGKGLSNDDHCHATDKETKWKTLRQVFKYEIRPASYLEKHRNVVHPTTPSGRHQEYYEGCTPEEYRVEDEGEYFEPDEEATVCVRNLPYDIDSEDLAQLFVYAGVVVFSEIIYDRETGQSCGYGFVTMSTIQEAEKAVELYHRREMDGRAMTVSKASATRVARTRTEEGPSPRRSLSSFKIYVANIPWRADSSSLKQLFSEYGEVINAKVVKHHGVRAFGFVTMATPEASDHAIWYLNNQTWTGRRLRVRFAKEKGRA